jgi:hypothetical protein
MGHFHKLQFINNHALNHNTKEPRVRELQFVNKDASNHDKKEHMSVVKQHAAFKRWDHAFATTGEAVRSGRQPSQARHGSNMQLVTPTWKVMISRRASLSFLHIGGLRIDPFSAFPISNKGQVPSAFDYCKHVLAFKNSPAYTD